MLKTILFLKRACFSRLRRLYLTRRIRSILHYLKNVEVREGFALEGLERVLVLAPHPDDESIGCGGTIRTLTASGVRCDVLFMTVGEKSYLPPDGRPFSFDDASRAKKRMAIKACDILGVSEVFYLGGTDGELHEELWRERDIVELINRNGYQRVFCPWAHDTHSDHAATFRMLEKAVAHLTVNIAVWLYEVWNPLVANRVVDIDRTIDEKVKAINCYKQGEDDVDYGSHFVGLSRYRSLLIKKSRHAEAFLVVNAAQIVGMKRSFRSSLEICPRSPLASVPAPIDGASL